MHGAGERGSDNRYQFFRFNPVEFWKKYPRYIIAPQCPATEDGGKKGVWVDTPFGAVMHKMNANPTWELQSVMNLIDKVIRENNVDRGKVYVTGLSMGGFGTWETLQREPSKFKAAIPICCGGDIAYAGCLTKIPIWAFHGNADNTVQVNCSRNMVAAIKAAGGQLQYTEYPNVGHGAWCRTYSNAEVWDWLFQQ